MQLVSYAEVRSLFLQAHRPLILTGAGISTDSGIPDYRSPSGAYSRGHRPMTHDEFCSSPAHRQRYWFRSMLGYPSFARASANAGHVAIANMQRTGLISDLVTQNVDGLHQKAGSEAVMELHGSSHRVGCMHCRSVTPRVALQRRLVAENHWWLRQAGVGSAHLQARIDPAQQRPDGDTEMRISKHDLQKFRVPACEVCGVGILKPSVTFFGDIVPEERARRAKEAALSTDLFIVVGSTVSTYSAFRLVVSAAESGAAVLVLNDGDTRCERDGVPHFKMQTRCADVLPRLVADLARRSGHRVPVARSMPHVPRKWTAETAG